MRSRNEIERSEQRIRDTIIKHRTNDMLGTTALAEASMALQVLQLEVLLDIREELHTPPPTAGRPTMTEDYKKEAAFLMRSTYLERDGGHHAESR